MPAAATPTPARAIRTNMRRMTRHRMIMAITIITMTIITTTITITTTSIATTIIITTIPMLMTTNRPPPIEDRGGMSENEVAALYRLMTWLSPAFPVGAFSYSSGIEWAVEAGDIADAASLTDWLASMLADGSGFCDGVFLAHPHRAAARPGIATAGSQ